MSPPRSATLCLASAPGLSIPAQPTVTHPDPDLHRLLVIEPVRHTPKASVVVHTRIAHLSTALLNRVQPDAVVAPLMTPRWDILDLARRLQVCGFGGRVLVQTRPLPRADLVLGEIRALFPTLQLALVEDAA